MAEFKVVLNDITTGKSYQKILTSNESESLVGLKIGSVLSGQLIGLEGYELELRGGSDLAGFPMRHDVEGSGRKKPYISHGPGVRKLLKGEKTRKTVLGNIVGNNISQLNLKVVKYGTKNIGEILGIKKSDDEIVKSKESINADNINNPAN